MRKKELFCLITMLLIVVSSFAHAVEIFDEKFEQALVDFGHDNAVDGWIEDEITNKILVLNVSNYHIEDMSALEYFFGLRELNCSNNALETLDLSNNPFLYSLDCSHNELKSINLIFSKKLKDLNCSHNSLTSLDLTRTINLETIDFSNNQIVDLKNHVMRTTLIKVIGSQNQLKQIELSANTNLQEVVLNNNALVYLGLQNGNNTKIKKIKISNNQQLKCVEVDDVVYSKTHWKVVGKYQYATKCE